MIILVYLPNNSYQFVILFGPLALRSFHGGIITAFGYIQYLAHPRYPKAFAVMMNERELGYRRFFAK